MTRAIFSDACFFHRPNAWFKLAGGGGNGPRLPFPMPLHIPHLYLSCILFFQRLVCISHRPGFSLRPSLAVYEFDPSWQLCQRQVHHIEGLNYAHDFILLPDYYVFHMTPFVKGTWWTQAKIHLGLSSPGEEMRYYPELPSRFVIIPRHGSGDSAGVILVDTDPCHVSFYLWIFHIQSMGNFQWSIKGKLGKHWFCFVALCDWSRKLRLPVQLIRC